MSATKALAFRVLRAEVITLHFITWDTSGTLVDSLILLDNFRRSAIPSNGPITTN